MVVDAARLLAPQAGLVYSRSNGRCVRCVAALWKEQLGLANMLLHSLGAVIVDLCCVLDINMLWCST